MESESEVRSLMTENKIFAPSEDFKKGAHIKSIDEYRKMYERSLRDPDGFWAEEAETITWFRKWDHVSKFDFRTGDIKWFEGGKLNVSYNCLDRHVENGHGDDTAIIWEGNDPAESKTFTYRELLAKVERFANVLKSKGIQKGDRVCIYLQMIPELAISMLACSRIGAVHSIVFGGFSADSLRDRINDSKCKLLVTQDSGYRGAKPLPMKTTADRAVEGTPSIDSVIVVKRTKEEVDMGEKDLWWHEEMEKAEEKCPPEELDAEDPLFILYTSGSTGKPKGSPYQRRLSRIRSHESQIRIRLPRWGRILVHSGYRLDHGTFLHRLRPPGPGGHDGDVRGIAHLPRRRAALAHRRAAQC